MRGVVGLGPALEANFGLPNGPGFCVKLDGRGNSVYLGMCIGSMLFVPSDGFTGYLCTLCRYTRYTYLPTTQALSQVRFVFIL